MQVHEVRCGLIAPPKLGIEPRQPVRVTDDPLALDQVAADNGKIRSNATPLLTDGFNMLTQLLGGFGSQHPLFGHDATPATVGWLDNFGNSC